MELEELGLTSNQVAFKRPGRKLELPFFAKNEMYEDDEGTVILYCIGKRTEGGVSVNNQALEYLKSLPNNRKFVILHSQVQKWIWRGEIKNLPNVNEIQGKEELGGGTIKIFDRSDFITSAPDILFGSPQENTLPIPVEQPLELIEVPAKVFFKEGGLPSTVSPTVDKLKVMIHQNKGRIVIDSDAVEHYYLPK